MDNETLKEQQENTENIENIEAAEAADNIEAVSGEEETSSGDMKAAMRGIASIPAAVEAILFASGDSVDVQRIIETLDISEEEAEAAIAVLDRRYKKKDSGIELLHLENSLQLVTKRDYYDILKILVKTNKQQTLSETALETLSIIAYKQPVTRVEIEKIRGVSCAHQIDKLLEYDLIKEISRLEAPGRPMLFGTTEQFLRSFGVSSIEELPRMNPDKMADFMAEAEKEIETVPV